MKCLDTDILIAFLRGSESALEYIRKSRDRGEKLATTWVNSCELLKGAHSFGSDAEIAGVHSLLSGLDVLLPTAGTAELYAGLYSVLKKKGKPAGDFDLIIAAIAMENDCTLVTSDRDFENIQGIRLEKWR